MDKIKLGFKITELIATSDEPLEELKYLKEIIFQMWDMYIDREDVRMSLRRPYKGDRDVSK